MHILVLPSAYNTSEHALRGNFFKEQSEALRKSGNQVGVIYSETRPVTALSFRGFLNNHFQATFTDENGLNTVRLHGWNVLSMRNPAGKELWVRQTLILFKKYIKRYGKPDIIHVHCGLYAGIAAEKIKEKYGIPYVVTEHSSIVLNDTMCSWDREKLKKVYDNADFLIAVGTRLKNSMMKLTDREVEVVPNIVNTKEFHPIYKKNDDIFRFVSVAYLKKNKNIDMTIRAFASLYGDSSSIKLVIAGDGTEEGNLKALAKELGAENSIEFLGRVERQQLAEVLRMCDAFVLPSSFETFGVSYIEALASGIPVIATMCGGPEDFVNNDIGRIIPVGDVEALKDAMEFVRENNKLFSKNALSKYAEEKFGEEIIINNLLKIYNSILSN